MKAATSATRRFCGPIDEVMTGCQSPNRFLGRWALGNAQESRDVGEEAADTQGLRQIEVAAGRKRPHKMIPDVED